MSDKEMNKPKLDTNWDDIDLGLGLPIPPLLHKFDKVA